jgi:hypothetical protein
MERASRVVASWRRSCGADESESDPSRLGFHRRDAAELRDFDARRLHSSPESE